MPTHQTGTEQQREKYQTQHSTSAGNLNVVRWRQRIGVRMLDAMDLMRLSHWLRVLTILAGVLLAIGLGYWLGRGFPGIFQ